MKKKSFADFFFHFCGKGDIINHPAININFLSKIYNSFFLEYAEWQQNATFAKNNKNYSNENIDSWSNWLVFHAFGWM